MVDYVADLHLHSRYSRAVSQNMTLPIIRQFALQKGLHILSACDWTHPLWIKEMSSQLEEAGEGLYKINPQIISTKSQTNANDQNLNTKREPLFLLSTEISCIYKQGEKLRRIHNLVFVPSLAVAEKVNAELMRRGCNLRADGRPIVGMSSKQLLELVLSINEHSLLIPAHIWTPHFGIYGSASGFNSLEEAFGDLAKYIYGIETGLSSDPEMNWEVTELLHRSILSFSDAHSPAKMGRELTVFVENKNGISNDKSQMTSKQITYNDIAAAIKRDPKGNVKVGYTIEFYPEEGKYHFSGHRNCKVVYGPEEIRTKGNICPVCKRRLTEGVLYRVQQLADDSLLDRVATKMSPLGIKWYIDKNKNQPPYVKLVPLLEIVAESIGSPVTSPKAKMLFDKLCSELDSELTVLLKSPIADIGKIAGEKVGQGVEKVRHGTIVIDPGFDGEYGKVEIFGKDQKEGVISTDSLGEPEKKEQLGLSF